MVQKSMKIGFLSAHNPFDRSSFSGTTFHAFSALMQKETSGDIAELRLLGNHRAPAPMGRPFRKMRKALQRSAPELKFFDDQDLGAGLDWIVSLVSTYLAVELAPRLKAPLVHVTDATPAFLREFYGWPIDQAHEIAERTLITEVADKIVYSSEYMRQQAIAEFGAQFADKMNVLPFGLNLDTRPHNPSFFNLPSTQDEPLQLLFIGKDWERKGGEIALQTLTELHRAGRNAHLSIVGCHPTQEIGQNVSVFESLNKSIPAEKAQFEALLKKAHFLILPTRADCTPMVIAEANAYSVPALVTNVGGVASLVTDGENGQLFNLEASPTEWARGIMRISLDPARYSRMRQASFDACEKKLNWDAWASNLIELLGRRQP